MKNVIFQGKKKLENVTLRKKLLLSLFLTKRSLQYINELLMGQAKIHSVLSEQKVILNQDMDIFNQKTLTSASITI